MKSLLYFEDRNIVICPKCGREGKLRSVKRNCFGKRKYAILHEDGSRCSISWLDGDIWDKLNEIYERIRLRK